MTISVVITFSPGPREVVEIPLTVEHGCTISQALRSTDFLEHPRVFGLDVARVGVWGKKVSTTQVLMDQDRLEIYRPLTVDPKVARRERFAKQGAKRAAGLFARRRSGAKAGY